MLHPIIQVLLAATVLSSTVRSQMAPACAGVPHEMFVRNSMSCADYFHCSDEVPSTGRCPPMFAFDPHTQSCNSEYTVDCTICSQFGIQNIADPNDCRRYYRCVSGQRTHRTCADSLVFDPSIGDCNIGNAAQCSSESLVCRSFANIGFLRIGDPSDCTKFFNCLNGVSYIQSCANGLYFNAHTGNCEIPGTFNFCQDYGPIINGPFPSPVMPPAWVPAPAPAPSATTTQRPAVATTTVRAVVTQPAVPGTTAKPLDPRCIRAAGYFLVAGSCVDYVYCIKSEVRFEFTCSEGYWYDEDYELCRDVKPPGC